MESETSTTHSTSSAHDSHHPSPGMHAQHSVPKPKGIPVHIIVIALVLIIGVGWYISSNNHPTPAPAPIPGAIVKNTGTADVNSRSPFSARLNNDDLLKKTLSKAKYSIEVYRVDRSTYHIFQQAAEFLGISMDDTKAFFQHCCDLTSENDIFSELPPIPSDFAAVAFDVATGAELQIGQLTKAYYLQPEFYFHVGETAGVNRRLAFRGWANPDLQYWGDNGHSSYPSVQWGTVSKSSDQPAVGVVYYGAAWNIQNWQGLQLVPDANSAKFFDVQIQADSTGQPYFLLGPTFPRFSKQWVEKVVITVRPKKDTPPGDYVIGIDPALPPKAINDKWVTEHRGVYFGGKGTIATEGNQVEFHVSVQP